MGCQIKTSLKQKKFKFIREIGRRPETVLKGESNRGWDFGARTIRCTLILHNK
jgi:hypothetical protein